MKLLIATTVFFLTTIFSYGQNNMTLDSTTSAANTLNGYFHYCDLDLTIDLFADSVNSLGADINGMISTTNFQPSPVEVVVYWGDGFSSVHTGTVTNQGQAVNFNPPIYHNYQTSGYYSLTYIITNPLSQSMTGDTVNVSMGNPCEFDFYSSLSVDCDSNNVIESTINSGVDIVLTDGQGQTYTETLNNGMITFSGVPAGTYAFEVDPQWLSTNGYNAFYSPPLIIVDTLGSPQTTQAILYCQDSISQSQQNCLAGYVFCDDNQNGFWDQGETTISNAPLNIYPYNSGSFTSFTDQNGFFQTTFTDPNTGGPQYTVVELNNNWLTQNGYSQGYYIDTVFNTTCGQNDTLFIPVQCPINIDTNCISGYVFCDDNGNQVFDNNESPIMGAPISIVLATTTITVYSDSFGYYNYCSTEINAPNITFQATIDQNWLNSNNYTAAGTYLLNSSTTPSQNNSVPIDCSGNASCTDLWASVNPWIGYFQNQNNYIQINWGSYGPGLVGNYNLNLTFPSNTTPNTNSFSNQNYTITGNTITWTLNENSASFFDSDYISFFTNSGIPSGTAHNFSISITPAGTNADCNPTNNYQTLLQIVGNSYDPNDKLVDHEEAIDPAVVDTLTYTVRFQNTGTAPAQDVYILDTIDNNLNYATLKLLSTSHNMNLIELGNNIIRFDFPQIWLPDSSANEPLSHGYVTYSIVESAANAVGDGFSNTAYIYFDWNPAIITNTTFNINVEDLSTTNLEADLVKVYPNPAQNKVNIETVEVAERIQIIDMNGRTIKNIIPQQHHISLDLTSIETGVYIIHVYSQDALSSYKLIKN